MTTSSSIDIEGLPEGLGAPKPLQLAATRYLQGGRTMYHVTPTLADLPRFIVKRPDPEKPLEGNRRVEPKRAEKFAEYITEREDWVSAALIVNAPKGDVKFDAKHEFPDGTAWGILEIPVAALHGVELLDGQHRTLGTFLALEQIEDRIREKRDAVEIARNNGNDEVVGEIEKSLKKLLAARERLAKEHVAIDVVEVRSDQRKQMFVDIADNAKGINRDLTTVLDQREAVNRISVELIENHPLLKDRVESGQAGRMSSKNPALIGAKSVGDIVRALNVGIIGRVGKRTDDELAKNLTAATEDVSKFLDTMVAAFPDLSEVQDGELEPLDMRKRSLLGSATMLRVLAGLYYELSNPEDGSKPMTRSEIADYFGTLAPKMDRIPIAEDDSFWMPSGAFMPGTNAPQARQGSLKQLVNYLAGKARTS
jgi:hypothetical protein